MESMLIGSRERLSTLSDTLKLFIDNFPIEQVSCVKSLGAYINENLTWHCHIDKMCKKNCFCNWSHKVSQAICASVYSTLHIQLTSSTSHWLLQLSLGYCMSSNFELWCWWRFLVSQTQLEWLAISMSNSESPKSLQGLVPEYLTSKFVMPNESNYDLRDSVNKLDVPFQRTTYMKYSFSYSGATL